MPNINNNIPFFITFSVQTSFTEVIEAEQWRDVIWDQKNMSKKFSEQTSITDIKIMFCTISFMLSETESFALLNEKGEGRLGNEG